MSGRNIKYELVLLRRLLAENIAALEHTHKELCTFPSYQRIVELKKNANELVAERKRIELKIKRREEK